MVGVDAPRLRARALSEAVDAAPDDDVLLAEDDRASFTVVIEARAPVAVGDTVELTVDPRACTASTSRRARRWVTAPTPKPAAITA